MRRCVRLALAVLAGLAAVPSITYAQASITGVVRDASGAVLPGVTVEAASPVLIEKVRSVVSDGSGQYRIENLRPGAYVITFTLPGFATVRREGIELSGTFVATVNSEMRVGGLEETITVTGESPIIDVQSTTRQRVLDHEVLDALPSNRAPQIIAGLVPGISRSNQDVGGNVGDGSGKGTITTRGVTESRTVFAGVPTLTAAGPGHKAYNLEVFQEVTVDNGGVGVEHREGGVRIGLIPKDGGNTFHGNFLLNFANDSMQGSNITQELKDAGLRTGDSVKQLMDVNPGVGGPIVRDKVWFHATTRYARAWNYVPLYFNKNAGNPNAWTYEPDTSRKPAANENTIKHANGRVTWQATARNKLAFTYDYSDICDCPRGLTASISPEANLGSYVTFKPPTSQLSAEWTSPLSNRMLLETTFYTQVSGFKRAETNPYFAPTPEPMIAATEQSTGMSYRATASLNDLVASTFYARAVLSYITGAHAFKVGFVGGIADTEQKLRSPDAPISFRFNNGVPNQVTLFATPVSYKAKLNADHGLFVEDKWTIKRLTLTGGLRYDYFNLEFPEVVVGPSTFTPSRNIVFPETPGANLHDISPRTGLVVDVFGNGKTAVKVSAGKYLYGEHVSGTAFSNAAPANRLVNSASRSWTDTDRDFVPDCDLATRTANGECGAITNANFGSTVAGLTFDPDVINGWGKRRYNWQFAAGVQQQVLPRVSVGVEYWRTAFGNFIVTQDRSYTQSDFDRFSITAPVDPRLPGGGGYVVSDLVNVKPAAFGRAANGYVTFAKNFGKQIEHWNGVDVTMNARLGGGVLLQGGTSTERQTTDNCEVVTQAGGLPPERGTGVPVYNPSQLYCHVNGSFRTQAKFIGSYTIPRVDVQVSASFQNLPGPEVAANYVATNAVVAPSLGRPLAGGATNVTVNLVEPRTMYGERMTQIDLRVGKIVRLGPMRATASLDLYNALNDNPVLAESVAYANWRQPQSILNARFAKVNLQFSF